MRLTAAAGKRPGGRATRRPMAEKVRDHLANERTFLAWVRTALGLIGLGFVLARMGLFLRQLTAAAEAERMAAGPGLRQAGAVGRSLHAGNEFLVTGVVFLALGTALVAWSGWMFGR